MARLASLNERRVVTVLSVDIAESTKHVAGMDPDDAMELLDHSFSFIQDAIASAGGTVISFNGDGALAIFGWPETIERHADNACSAAWDIQQAASAARDNKADGEEPIWHRVGVHSGLVALRKIELALSSRIDAIGECVHIATHIQKSASVGDVLVSGQTVNLCRRVLSLEKQVALADDKKLPPIERYRLLDRPRELSLSDYMRRHEVKSYGREEEVRSLLRFAAPQAGAPAVCALVGDAGIGKSHIASVVARLAADNNVQTLLIEANDVERASPFSTARRLIRKTLSADPQDFEAMLLEYGVPAVDAKIVAAVVGPQSTAAALEETSSPAIVKAMATAILHVALRQRRLLILEDLHNIDPDSCAVFERLAGEAADHDVAILATARPEARSAAERLCGAIIDLLPIRRDAMRDLLHARLSQHTFTRLQLDSIIDRADGNPFILEQLIQNIGSAGPDISDLLPQSVEALIHTRIDKLSPSARDLAKTLSLLGDRIDLKFAEAVVGVSIHDHGHDLSELSENGIIHPPHDGKVRFRHALVADACETMVRKSERRRLHTAAIEYIKACNPDLRHSYAILAHHAIRAGKDEEALDYLWRAARQARSLAAGRSLMSIFEQAMACCERLGPSADERLVRFVLLSFETFQLLGEIDRIAPYLSQAVAYSEHHAHKKELCIAQCHLGFTHWYRGDYIIGAALMRGVLEEAKRLDHLPLRFSAQLLLAHHLHALSQIDEAFGLVSELCDLLSGELELVRLGAVGLPACIANAFAGYYLIDKGDYEAAEMFSRKALDIAERGKDIYSQVLARLGLGRLLIRMARYEEAVDCLRANQEMIEAYGFDTSRPNNLGMLCTAMSRTGQASEAVAMVQRRLDRDLVKRTGRLERHYFSVGYGEALVASGRFSEGLTEIEDAVQIGRATGNMGLLIQSIGLKAAILEMKKPGHDDIASLRAEERRIADTYGLARLKRVHFTWV